MITIETLKKEHISKVVEIEEKLLEETLGNEMLQAELHNKYAHFYVALDNDIVVGYIGAWIIEGTTDMINFVVDSNYQHQGIGQLLMQEIINQSEQFKEDLVVKFVDKIQKDMEIIVKQSESILSSTNKILDTCEDMKNKLVKNCLNKIEKLDITKLVKKIDNI